MEIVEKYVGILIDMRCLDSVCLIEIFKYIFVGVCVYYFLYNLFCIFFNKNCIVGMIEDRLREIVMVVREI